MTQRILTVVYGSPEDMDQADTIFKSNWRTLLTDPPVLAKQTTSSVALWDYQRSQEAPLFEKKGGSKSRHMLETWRAMFRFFGKSSDVRWFVMVDPSTFINVHQLKQLILYVEDTGHDHHYLGVPMERSKLPRGEEEDPEWVCARGAVVVGLSVVRRIATGFSECLVQIKYEDDPYRELGRCIHRLTQLRCAVPPISIYQLASSKELAAVGLSEGQETRQAFTPDLFKTAFVYPVTNVALANRIFLQTSYNLRPVTNPSHIPPNIDRDDPSYPLLDPTHDYCVNNPSMQLRNYPMLYLPECPAPIVPPQEINIAQVPTFILNLEGDFERFLETKSAFARHNIQAERFLGFDGRKVGADTALFDRPRQFNLKEEWLLNASPKVDPTDIQPIPKFQRDRPLTSGERGYRITMRRMFEHAIKHDLPYMIVLDDDAVPHCDFERKFKELMREDRCGGHILSETHGGVLMLGFAIWRQGSYPNPGPRYTGWGLVDDDIKNHTTPHHSQCLNAHDATVGSFGVMYHKNVYQSILEWLDHYDEPFDWVFAYLAEYGFIVRGAYPNLVIQNVDHVSRVDPTRRNNENLFFRAKIHRWKCRQYCLSDGSSLNAGPKDDREKSADA